MPRTPDTLSHYLQKLRGSDSQEKAAAKAKVTRWQWLGWEAGQGISAKNADKIAKAYGRPAQELRRYVRSRPRPEDLMATLKRMDERITRLERLVRSQGSPAAPRGREDVHESK